MSQATIWLVCVARKPLVVWGVGQGCTGVTSDSADPESADFAHNGCQQILRLPCKCPLNGGKKTPEPHFFAGSNHTVPKCLRAIAKNTHFQVALRFLAPPSIIPECIAYTTHSVLMFISITPRARNLLRMVWKERALWKAAFRTDA